jgi:hypothetical protein
LPLILDHKDGCRENNSPSNLWHLCPNCDSQQTLTRGGANRGRVQDRGECGYSIIERGSPLDKHCKAFDGGTVGDQVGDPPNITAECDQRRTALPVRPLES